MTRYDFARRDEFLGRLRALVEAGTPPAAIRLQMPYEVAEVEEILGRRPDPIRFFTLFGGLLGFATGLALTIYSVVSFPLIVGGKPIVSVPPFLLIGYLLTILFGSLGPFLGFLLSARLPSPSGLAEGGGASDRFVIEVEEAAR